MAWLGRFDDFDSYVGDSNFQNKHSKIAISHQREQQTGQSAMSKKFTSIGFLGKSSDGFCPISDIDSSGGMQTVNVLGIVIAKDGPRSFTSKKDGSDRHLVSLTIRDSPEDFINVTCWGGNEYIQALASGVNLGDVVELKGAQIQGKTNNTTGDRFKPTTSSTYSLNIGENNGSINPYFGDTSEFQHLINIPTKFSNDFYTLEDILANGVSLQGEHVNLLVAVKKLWPVREITTKTGKKTTKVDVVVFDDTCDSFSLTLWDNFVSQGAKWVPYETVLFAADVKINYNDFKSSMVATSDCKTIFTENPETREGRILLDFSQMQGADLEKGNGVSGHIDPDVNSISNVCNVKELKEAVLNSDDEPVFAVLLAYLTTFDIDCDSKSIYRAVCSSCHYKLEEDSGSVCTNAKCAGSSSLTLDGNTSMEYSLTVSLSDETGTLENCYIQSKTLEQLIGYTATDFAKLTESQKSSLKWDFLTERFKSIVKIRKAFSKEKRSRPIHVNILDMEKVSPLEMLKLLNEKQS